MKVGLTKVSVDIGDQAIVRFHCPPVALMSVAAVVVSLTQKRSLRLIASGLVCPSAEYAAVKWYADGRIERRAVLPTAWSELKQQIATHPVGAPVPHDSALHRLLVDEDTEMTVHCVATLTAHDTSRAADASDLDAILHATRGSEKA